MTKKEFLSGDAFCGNSNLDSYQFVANDGNGCELGHIIRINNEGRKHYANVEKANSVSVSIYLCGMFKIHRESLRFAKLKKIGGTHD